MTHSSIPAVYYSKSASASPLLIPKKYPLEKCFLLYSILKFYRSLSNTRHLRITKLGGTRGNLAKNRHQTTPRASFQHPVAHANGAARQTRSIPRIPPSPFSASREEVQPLSARCSPRETCLDNAAIVFLRGEKEKNPLEPRANRERKRESRCWPENRGFHMQIEGTNTRLANLFHVSSSPISHLANEK